MGWLLRVWCTRKEGGRVILHGRNRKEHRLSELLRGRFLREDADNIRVKGVLLATT